MEPRRGRPCRAGERASERVEVRVTPGELDALRRFVAKHRYANISDAIRLVLMHFIAESEDAPDFCPDVIRNDCDNL